LAAATLSLGLVVLLGTPLAYLLARRRFPGKILVEGLVVLPLVTPPLVMGLLLVFVYGPYAFLGEVLGRVGVGFTDVFPGLVLAETYVAFPYYVLAARAAFLGVSARLEEVSWLLGRTPGQTFRRITLPLARGGLLAGAAMAWARAIGEFGATVILAYHPYGLPLKIWVDLNDLGLPQALPLAAILLLVAAPLPLAALLGSRANHA
jgi:molybdate/tungstate transport system permease protein